jgi:hypothetical protein
MEQHFVCTGGCKGVSPVPGVCGAETCASHNHELVECMYTDSTHNNFTPCEHCGKMCGGTCQTA